MLTEPQPPRHTFFDLVLLLEFGSSAVRLRDLTIENYRSFEKYKLDDLARVNLLVGDNNCGKTSVLESAYLLAANGSPNSIWTLLQSRGEISFVYEGVNQADPVFAVRVPELFRGTTIAGKQLPRIAIRAGDFGEVRLSLGSRSEVDSERQRDRADFPDHSHHLKSGTGMLNGEEGCLFYARFIGSDQCAVTFQHLTNEGNMRRKTPTATVLDGVGAYYRMPDPIAEFMPTANASAETLKADWVRVLQNQRDGDVIKALRVALPMVNEILVLPTPMSPPQARSHIIIRTNGTNAPISRLGEGVNRLLTLGMSLANSAGGFLFVDEIDTGLHHSRLSDMWRMIIKTAANLDIQVFTTTHSLDCIRGLAAACDEDSSLHDQVALFSIDRRMDEAVRFAGDEVSVVVDHEIEVR